MAERYVGVTSGGMDQAISMLGTLGSAKLISFDPVRASDVPLPNGATFVVANSLAVSNKAEAATGRYNMRFVECRLASAALALGLGLTPEQARSVRTMKEIEAQVLAKQNEMGLTGKDQDDLTPVVHKLLHAEPYTTAELESSLQAPLTALFTQTPASALVLAAHSSFKLRDRAEHVFAEKTRVLQFQRVSLNATASGSAMASLEALGQLMDASHASCRDLYECSCPELETLVTLAKKSGALGSRLTGAGWGGCSVSLVPQGKVQSFLDALRKEYYTPLMKEGRCDVDDLDKQLFASKPAAGGALLVLDL
ncbi:hypothetical protein H632_c8p0 [Helicosporidium sp. ATCC 50920]|nr:hypothetical protein H632_c8p0 [Helicosporidium sp. ATCC 50920]|eukprot:KDD77147.1 hypothetical protein H632_c8p0 [Helicosporidium sp. ATCC 50920]